MGYGGAGGHWQIVAAGAFQHVRQGQEGQKSVFPISGNALQHTLYIEQDVAMAEHDTLGPAGGAGGINNGGQCVGVNRFDTQCVVICRQPVLCRKRLQAGSGGFDRIQRNNALQARQRIVNRLKRLPLLRATDHQQPGATVLQHQADVVRTVIHIQGDQDEAESLGGDIEGGPLRAVGGHNGNTVTFVKIP